MIKEGKVLGRLGVGKAFGELAILYNCKRTASIKVTADSILLPEETCYCLKHWSKIFFDVFLGIVSLTSNEHFCPKR